mmetsp:Transcript_29462/g.92163  ORF Transcript_29462/g.92163 Transcript_29462/m.92163 type:complete len:159 (-) Transcript_29462:120-596(-)
MAEGAAPSAGLEEEAGGISLHSLSYEQLMQLKNSIEEELQGLQGAHQQLQVSTKKLQISKAALDELTKTSEGTRMLVPITSSLYVPGETSALQSCLVDVGTGYYIEKSVAEAQAFMDRKIELMANQTVGVRQAAAIKGQHMQQAMQVLNEKRFAAKQG